MACGAAADGISTFGIASYRISAAGIPSSRVDACRILSFGIRAPDEGRLAVRPAGFGSPGYRIAAFGVSPAGRASDGIAPASGPARCRTGMRWPLVSSMVLRETLAVKPERNCNCQRQPGKDRSGHGGPPRCARKINEAGSAETWHQPGRLFRCLVRRAVRVDHWSRGTTAGAPIAAGATISTGSADGSSTACRRSAGAAPSRGCPTATA
jgi:hypothetical protein